MDYIKSLEGAMGKTAVKRYLSMQLGDVTATAADTEELNQWVDFKPKTQISLGIDRFVEWYKSYTKLD
jgi:UDP-glucuronate 4-epimerase